MVEKHKTLIKILLGLVSVAIVLVFVTVWLNARSAPRLIVCGSGAGLKSKSQLKQLVNKYLASNQPQSIQVSYKDKTVPFVITSLKYIPEDTVDHIIMQNKVKVGPFGLPKTLALNNGFYQPMIDHEEINQLIASVSASLDKPAIEPEVVLQTVNGIRSIKVMEGQSGEEVDQYRLIADLTQALACPKPVITINAIFNTTGRAITDNQKEQTKIRAEKLIGKSIKLTLEYQEWEVKDEQLISFVAFDGSYNQAALNNYAEEIRETISREPENAAFQFENGRVTLFRPAKDGFTLDQKTFSEELVKSLVRLEAGEEKTFGLPIPVMKTPPLVTNKEVNDLGINELVGRGTSTYIGSIPGRIHNLILASERLNGTLIAPGEEFSFNKALGEVSGATGYQPAYVIKSGRTVLGDGGGVCQTSTTMFRAILDAGLPIAERHAHAYRVHYYEDDLGPGYDATVYSPSVDLKFVNDTPAYLLLQTKVDKAKLQLTYELYGTSDGRKSEVSKARVWARVPAPPALYQDDPTLKTGVVRQIDWAAPGAKTAFDYKVTRNGETIQEKTFSSNYRPWQAIYLRGTKT